MTADIANPPATSLLVHARTAPGWRVFFTTAAVEQPWAISAVRVTVGGNALRGIRSRSRARIRWRHGPLLSRSGGSRSAAPGNLYDNRARVPDRCNRCAQHRYPIYFSRIATNIPDYSRTSLQRRARLTVHGHEQHSWDIADFAAASLRGQKA